MIFEAYCSLLKVHCYNVIGIQYNRSGIGKEKLYRKKNAMWIAQEKQEKLEQKYLRDLQLHFTMALWKVYIFVGFSILQLRWKVRVYMFDN